MRRSLQVHAGELREHLQQVRAHVSGQAHLPGAVVDDRGVPPSLRFLRMVSTTVVFTENLAGRQCVCEPL
jgi:hypothetical protein